MHINTIQKIDNLFDYVPVVSTISNSVNLIAKIIFENYSQNSIQNSPYLVYISQKSYMRCLTLLIPVLGIVTVSIYDKINDAFSHQRVHQTVQYSNIIAKSPQNVRKKKIENPKATTLNSNNFSVKKNIKLENIQPNGIRLQTIDLDYKEEEWLNQVYRNIALKDVLSPKIIGIDNENESNPKSNCWCIAALQILCNTSVYSYITTSPSTLKNKFPKIFEFIKTYKEGKQSSKELGEKIKDIRLEISQVLGEKVFPSSEYEEADAKNFLISLFEENGLDYKIIGLEGENTNKKFNHSIFKEREAPYIFIDSSTISMKQLDIDEIFDSTHYKLIGALRLEPGHYSALFQRDNIWYRCNDSKVFKLSETFPSNMLKEDIGIFFIAERTSAVNYTLTNLDD